MADSTEMRFWGWGTDADAGELPPHVESWLAQQFGSPLQSPAAPPSEQDVRISKSELSKRVASGLSSIVGAANVRNDRHARLIHAAGKSYLDLLTMRSGKRIPAPDAVVYPADHDAVRAVLKLCAKRGVAVVPFGGGTSVVGGVAPLRGDFESVIALDLGRMRSLLALDETSHVGTFAAGLRGPELEHTLRAHNLTLGHFPQSFEFSTVGGWVATRSAGQASSGYGRIDDLIVGARMATPGAELNLEPNPGNAAGPNLRALVAGSEGALGVITEVSLQLSQLPEASRYEAWMVPSFASGADALRALEQAGLTPEIARCSDRGETEMGVAFSGLDGTKAKLLDRYLRGRGVEHGSLMILGWEGATGSIEARRRAAVDVLGGFGAVALGRGAGRAWAQSRFHTPYLRDHLMSRGVMVETLETSTTWSNLIPLYRAVDQVLSMQAVVVGCHISHLYQTGASLYFTFLTPQTTNDAAGQWRQLKSAACQTIVDNGGAITHHHAIGVDHKPYLKAEDGAAGIAALRAVKRELDPSGVMNPGKLL